LPRNPKVCDCPRRSANAKLRATRLCSSVRKNEVRAGRGSRSRGLRQKTGDRAPARRTSSTFLSPAARTRLWKALPHSNRSRSISGCLTAPHESRVREERAPRRGPRCFRSWVVLPAYDDHSPHRANRSPPLPLLGTRALLRSRAQRTNAFGTLRPYRYQRIRLTLPCRP
jgi:hypothetical protein